MTFRQSEKHHLFGHRFPTFPLPVPHFRKITPFFLQSACLCHTYVKLSILNPDLNRAGHIYFSIYITSEPVIRVSHNLQSTRDVMHSGDWMNDTHREVGDNDLWPTHTGKEP